MEQRVRRSLHLLSLCVLLLIVVEHGVLAFLHLPASTLRSIQVQSTRRTTAMVRPSQPKTPLFGPRTSRVVTWSSVAGEVPSEEPSPSSTAVDTKSEEKPPRKVMDYLKDPIGSIKAFWNDVKNDRAKLAAIGASALCSYGLVSNVNYCITVMIAWVISAKKSGLSPLAPGQWKNFLAVYAGLWVAMNFLRPVRVFLSVGLTPYFDKVVETIRTKFGLKKPVAFGVTVFLVNVCGTLSFLFLGLTLTTRIAGVPLLPPK